MGERIPFTRALSSRPNQLSKVPPSNTIDLGIRFQHMNWWGRDGGGGGGHKHQSMARVLASPAQFPILGNVILFPFISFCFGATCSPCDF